MTSLLAILHKTQFSQGVSELSQVPEHLITQWLGHARTLTDRYASQLREDVVYRGEWCKRAGLGFSVVTLFHTNVVQLQKAKVA